MPKVTMTFNLPEEQSDLDLYRNAVNMSTIIHEFTQLCRNKTKYGTRKEQAIWEPVSTEWWNILKDENYDPYQA